MERFLRFLKNPDVQSRLASIRVKTLVKCGWTCKWCHQEGNFQANQLRLDQELIDTLRRFKDHFGFTEVHFTGGEPTLHVQLSDMIAATSSLGMVPKMTTNGQGNLKTYEALLSAGLQSVNVSMHTLDPGRLGQLMHPARTTDWGLRTLSKQLETVRWLLQRTSFKINTVVSRDIEDTLRVWRYCSDHNIPWRLMNAIGEGPESYDNLERFLNEVGGTIKRATHVTGSSSYQLTVEDRNGQEFRLKLLRPFYLNSMCQDCELRRQNECEEFAYGPRLEVSQDGTLQVRVCVHQNQSPYVQPADQFFGSPIAEEYRRLLRR